MSREQSNAIWCLIGNVKAPGTKHFSTGTKVYCLPPQWGDGYENIVVFGLHRESKKVINLIMPSKRIENWRVKLVYKPSLIKKIKDFEDSEPHHSIWKNSVEAQKMAFSLLDNAVHSLETKSTRIMRTSVNRKVKICGLTRPEDVESAILYGADFLGFIVEAKSARRISVLEAAKLSLPAKASAKTVAVTVNADDAVIEAIATQMQPDYIQFHGDESVDRLAEIARRFKIKTIKAVAVSTHTDMITAEQYAGVADFILYDAKPPKGETVRGGHGLSFDWNILTQSPLPKTWALAGGLTPDNVTEAIAKTHAPILDVSSGVENSPGIKDALKIEAFMRDVRAL